jgi:hypothetical protein
MDANSSPESFLMAPDMEALGGGIERRSHAEG